MEDAQRDMETPFSGGGNGSTPAALSDGSTDIQWWTHPLSVAGQSLWEIFPPLVIVLGTFGNLMTIVIMQRLKSGESNINLYFTAVAVLDLVILWINTLSLWMYHRFGVKMSAVHTAVCKIHTWMYTGIGTMSCWCLVCMTVHRAMSVVWPHRVNLLCTRRTVLLVIVGVVVFFALLYSHYLVGFERVQMGDTYWCTVGDDNAFYMYFSEHVFVYIELTVYSLLPFLVLVAANSVLVWTLSRSVQAAGRQLSTADPDQIQARERAARSVTLTVILVSGAFLLFTLPNSVNFIVNFLSESHSRVTGYGRAKLTFITAVCGMFSNVNYGINFYLYCLTGRRFREEFLQVLCCWRTKGGRGVHQ